MLSNLGNLLLSLNIILSLLLIYFSTQCIKTPVDLVFKKIYQICLIQSTVILICFFTLVAAYIISDFSLINVYENSHSAKPLFYKISGTWGNHEGSLLLWIIILTLFKINSYIKNLISFPWPGYLMVL